MAADWAFPTNKWCKTWLTSARTRCLNATLWARDHKWPLAPAALALLATWKVRNPTVSEERKTSILGTSTQSARTDAKPCLTSMRRNQFAQLAFTKPMARRCSKSAVSTPATERGKPSIKRSSRLSSRTTTSTSSETRPAPLWTCPTYLQAPSTMDLAPSRMRCASSTTLRCTSNCSHQSRSTATQSIKAGACLAKWMNKNLTLRTWRTTPETSSVREDNDLSIRANFIFLNLIYI